MVAANSAVVNTTKLTSVVKATLLMSFVMMLSPLLFVLKWSVEKRLQITATNEANTATMLAVTETKAACETMVLIVMSFQIKLVVIR